MPGEPSAWAMEQAGRVIGHTVSCMMQDGDCSCFLFSRCTALARCFDAAEIRGHQRAVKETAGHSVHKAVRAEREAIVAWLRDGGDACTTVGREYMRTAAAAIEAGHHHEVKP